MAAPTLRIAWIASLLLASCGAALAQFKIVDADGRVTYTDRPPAPSAGAQIIPLRRVGQAVSDEVALPFELRQPVARFPVTLYTAADCASCDNARRLLRARGVPHTEKLVDEGEAVDALARLTGGRTVPSLTVGAQVMRGYAEDEWQAMLDLAGYPRESRLPRNYVHAAATPLAARAQPTSATAPAAAPEPSPLPTPTPADAEPAGEGPTIRF